MSNGVSEYWKQKKLEERDIVIDARDALARVIQRPDLDKSPIVVINGQKYRFHTSFSGQPFTIESYDEIPVLGKLTIEVKE